MGNRISIVDLEKSEIATLPYENTKNAMWSLSPNKTLLLSIDDEGQCLLINRHRRVILWLDFLQERRLAYQI